jgi:hypothetical protein
VDLPDGAANGVLSSLPMVPDLISVTEVSTGRVVTVSSSDWWIWVVIAIVAFVVVVLAILLIIWCVKRRRNLKTSDLYVPLSTPSTSYLAPSTLSPAMIKCRLSQGRA